MKNKIDINKVADYFVSKPNVEAGGLITQLKLQKLLYYAKGVYYIFQKKALFPDHFEAWVHGPVCRKIRAKYHDRGNGALFVESVPEIDRSLRVYLNVVWDIYGQYTAEVLEDMTHKEKPWLEARGDISPYEKSEAILSEDTIKSYFITQYKNDEDYQDALDAALAASKLKLGIEQAIFK